MLNAPESCLRLVFARWGIREVHPNIIYENIYSGDTSQTSQLCADVNILAERKRLLMGRVLCIWSNSVVGELSCILGTNMKSSV